MMAKDKEEILAIDEELVCPISIGEARELKVIQKKFIESYFNHRDSMPVEKWLHNEMAEYLPEYSSEEVDYCNENINNPAHNPRKNARFLFFDFDDFFSFSLSAHPAGPRRFCCCIRKIVS